MIHLGMTTIDEVWAELSAELAERAPHAWASLRQPGVGVEQIEQTLAVVVNDETRRWFELQDGVVNPPSGLELSPSMFPISVQSSIQSTAMIREIWAEVESGLTQDTDGDPRVAGERVGTWLPGYLMIATDTCGGGLFVDLRPGPLNGCVRMWDKVQADGFDLQAESIAEWLRATLTSLRSGTRVNEATAGFADGVVQWRWDDR